ncbi:hypothetical protein D3C72_698540 [compost metagenome]
MVELSSIAARTSTGNEVWQRSRWALPRVLAKLKSKRRRLRSPIFNAGTSDFSVNALLSPDSTARRISSSVPPRRSLPTSGMLVMYWSLTLMLRRDSSLTAGAV